MISQVTYTYLKENYGKHSSWAIWRDNINEIDFLNEENICKFLRNDIVFIGLNRGGSQSDPDGSEWNNYHHGNDIYIKNAIEACKLEGCFMTDCFLHKTPCQDELEKWLDENDRENVCRDEKNRLNDIFNHLDADVKIIAMGDKAESYLKEWFGDKYKIVKIKHQRRGKELWGDNSQYYADDVKGILNKQNIIKLK